MAAKEQWLAALAEADEFARGRPPEELGCLYYGTMQKRFVVPRRDRTLEGQRIVLHFGTPGGVLPRIADTSIDASGDA